MPPATKPGVFTWLPPPAVVVDRRVTMEEGARRQFPGRAYPTGRDDERNELKRAFCSSLSPS
jgi:hypothetical protein